MKKSQSDIYAIMNDRLVPWGVSIEVTARCNIKCVHCYHPSAHNPQLNLDEMKGLLKDLAALGSMDLTFTGGEVFLRPDFMEILEFAVNDCGFLVKIFSNLTLLSEAQADILASLPINEVETTLLGPGSGMHDAITGVSGSFKATVNAIKMLTTRGVNVSAKTVAMTVNSHRLDDMYKLADRLRIEFRHDDAVFIESNGGRRPLSLQITDNEIKRMRRSFGSEDENEYSLCNCARSVLGIGSDGEVYPCGPFTESAGNIRDNSIADIWLNSPLMTAVRAMDDSDYFVCRDCHYRLRCNGCVAMGIGLSRGRKYPCRLAKRRLRKLS